MPLDNLRTPPNSSPCSSRSKKNIKREAQSSSDEHNPPPQFDSSDLGSPKKVWSVLCEKDEKYRRNPLLFQRQRNINAKMRSMLIDWLMDVCSDKHMHRETFHLCIDYIDRYINILGEEQVLPQRLQLIGSTALVIASKIEEIYPPKVTEVAEYTDGCCTDQDIRCMEEIMLQRLDWNFYPITGVHWLALYMQLMNTNDVVPAKHVIVTAEPSSLNVSIFSDLETAQEDTEEGAERLCNGSAAENSENHKPNTSVSSQSKHGGKCMSFNSTYPRFELSHIGASPKILLHTSSVDISYVGNRSYSSGHIYPDQRCTVPKLLRGEFVRMAKILDLVIMDAGSLRFRYRELATALLLCCYEPENLICQITDSSPFEVKEARDFVEPFVQLFDKLEPSGTEIPCIPSIPHSDRHNIQTYIPQCLTHLENLERTREMHRKALTFMAAASTNRLRKRKFGSLTHNTLGVSHEI